MKIRKDEAGEYFVPDEVDVTTGGNIPDTDGVLFLEFYGEEGTEEKIFAVDFETALWMAHQIIKKAGH